jgi:hypothetical protein
MIPVTWQQGCAWCIWRDDRIVQLVGPRGGDDDNLLTAERLIAEQEKSSRPPLYKHPRTIIRPVCGDGFLMFPSRSEAYGPGLAEMLPPSVGSIEAFQRAIADGRVTESSAHMFDLVELKSVFPKTTDSEPAADRPDPQAIEVAAAPTRAAPVRRRGEYQGEFDAWLARKPLPELKERDPLKVVKEFRQYCIQKLPNIVPLLPQRDRGMKWVIEQHLRRREQPKPQQRRKRQ